MRTIRFNVFVFVFVLLLSCGAKWNVFHQRFFKVASLVQDTRLD